MRCTISSAITRANLPHTGKRYPIRSCITEGTGFKYRTAEYSNHFLQGFLIRNQNIYNYDRRHFMSK